MPYTLGVDLGTTWTAAAAYSAGGAVAVPAGEQGPAFPSVVARDGDEIVVGEAAERRLAVEPASGVREPKRRLGDETPFVLGGAPFGAEALLGHLLGHVVARATEDRGEAPGAVVLTHPATWGEYKLDLVREAARVAGVADDKVSLVSEPQAAAWHYSTLGRMQVGDAVAVYDFGGGTFDAAVVRRTADGFEVVGQPKGLERLGGIDLDQAVFAHVAAALGAPLQELDGNDPAVRRGLLSLRARCTGAKEALSADSEASVAVDLPGLTTQVRITREEFEAMVRPRLAETLVAMQAAVTSAGVDLDGLTAVLLIGGSSRIPLVAEVVTRETGVPVAVDVDPKMAVAMGAAAYGRDERLAEVAPLVVEGGEQEAGVAAAQARGAETPAAGASSGRDRAVKIATGGAVAAGVVAAGAAAASARSGEPGAPDQPEPPRAPVETPLDPPVEPLAAAPREEGSSLDAFDDVAGPSPASSGGGGPARMAGRSERSARGNGEGPAGMEAPAQAGAPMGSTAPPPSGSPPAPASASKTAPESGPPGSTEVQLEAIRDQLRARVAAFQGPERADAEDVAALKADLGGLIDRFEPLPGQTVQEAYGALEHEMNQTIQIFTTSERAEIEREVRAEKQDALDADRKVWDTYRDALDRYVDTFVPSAPEHWWSPEELAQVKEAVKAQIIDRRPYVPQEGKTMRASQEDLEKTVDGALDQFRRQQYQKYLDKAVDDYRQTGSGLKPDVLKAIVEAKLKDPLVTPPAEAALDAASATALSAADVTGRPVSDRLGDISPGKVFVPAAGLPIVTATTTTAASLDPFDEMVAAPAASAAPTAPAHATAAAPAPAGPVIAARKAEEDVLGSERLIAEVEAAPSRTPASGPDAVPAGLPSSASAPEAPAAGGPMTEAAGWNPSPGIAAGGDVSFDDPGAPDDASSFGRPDDDPEPSPSHGAIPDDDVLGLP